MSNWEEYNLGEIGDFNNGVNKSKDSFGHGHPFVNLLDLFDKDRIEKIPKGLVDVNQDELIRYNLKEGDILFVRSSVKLEGVGKVSTILKDLENTIYSGFIIRFRQTNQVLEKIFSSYYLNSEEIRSQIIAKGTLSANSNINQESLKSIKIKIPSILVQRQIATILSTADAVIEKTQAAIAKYKAIKQGMLQDLFTRGIDTTTGKLRPSYQDAPELYKESKLGWIPKEWEVERLGNRAVIEYGKSQKTVVSINGTIPVYGTGGLMEYATDFLFDGESILIGRKGTIDKPFYIKGKFWSVDTAYYLSSFTGNVRWLHSQLEFYNLKRLNEATGVPSINRVLLYNIQLSFPNKIEQDEIVKRILSIDNKLHTEQDFLHKQQHIKAGLMGDLLSGRKRLNCDFGDLHDYHDSVSDDTSSKSQYSNKS